MKHEILVRAMGEIDEDLILEARRPVNLRRKYVKWTALAACVALLILVSPLALMRGAGSAKEEAAPEHDNLYGEEADNRVDWLNKLYSMVINSGGKVTSSANNNNYQIEDEGQPEERPSTICGVGETVHNEQGSVTFVEMTDTAIYLHISKTTDSETVIRVEILSEKKGDEAGMDGSLPFEQVAISVNGSLVESLPHEKGEYDIVLDFAKLLADPDLALSPRFTVEGFGVFGK